MLKKNVRVKLKVPGRWVSKGSKGRIVRVNRDGSYRVEFITGRVLLTLKESDIEEIKGEKSEKAN